MGRIQIEPTLEELQKFNAEVAEIGKLDGDELRQKFADNAKDHARTEILKHVLMARMVEVRLDTSEMSQEADEKLGEFETRVRQMVKGDGKVH